jgi:hypothetical protein
LPKFPRGQIFDSLHLDVFGLETCDVSKCDFREFDWLPGHIINYRFPEKKLYF